MVIFVVGLFLIALGAISLYRALKDNFSLTKYTGGFALISLTIFVYGLARLIRTYVKNKDHTIYWVWFAITITVTIIVTALFIFLLIKNRKNNKAVNA